MPAPTVVDSDTTLADGTEQTLFTTSTSNHYTASIDLSNMQSGDTLIIRAYKKVLTGSSFAEVIKETFLGAQDAPNFYIPFISCPFGYQLTIEQTGGTNRNYDWSVETP